VFKFTPAFSTLAFSVAPIFSLFLRRLEHSLKSRTPYDNASLLISSKNQIVLVSATKVPSWLKMVHALILILVQRLKFIRIKAVTIHTIYTDDR